MKPIVFEKIVFKQGDFHLNVNLILPGGKLSVILGPSGGGKTTLLDLCAGFLQPDSGRIFHGEQDVTPLPPESRNIGFVFQDHALFPHLTVMDNVAFGPRMKGLKHKDARYIARQKLALVGLEDLAKRRPDSLSGGERQRVSLARALATNPDILLLDEPFSSLDESLRLRLRREVRRIIDAAGVTALLVTHDQGEALAMADYLAVMNEGAIVSDGLPAEVWSTPKDSFTASFLGHKSWLHIQQLRKNSHGVMMAKTAAGMIQLPENHSDVRLPSVILIRPEYLTLSQEGSLRGQLVHTEFTGLGWRLELIPEHPFKGDLLAAYYSDTPPPEIGQFLSFNVIPRGIVIIECPRACY